MCGFVGLYDSQERTENFTELIRSMTNTIAHRGPDSNEVYVNGAIGLGHVRLSIIDLSNRGSQPMTTEDGRYVIVFNGEIYNYKEIRLELEKYKVSFNGSSDTEVLLKAWVYWGPDILKRLNGIFSFAIWDNLTKKLILARDRFGVKPLYYYNSDQGIVFGSEIKALLASKLIDKKINHQALHEFTFFGASLGQNTFFSGIKRLEPGQWLTYEGDKLILSSYHNFHNTEAVQDSKELAVDKIKYLLQESVKKQLVADVPVGIFLSGGIDSSLITAYASKHYSGKIDTFSAGFDFQDGVNELPVAKRISEEFNTNHHELSLKGDGLPSIIEDLVSHHDEPFSDAANIPLYILCKELKGNMKVVLQGDGGDEIFGGYRRYSILKHLYFWKSLSSFSKILPFGKYENFNRIKRISEALSQENEANRMAWLLTMDTKRFSFKDLLTKDWQLILSKTDPFSRYRKIISDLDSFSPVQKMLYCDTNILLPDIFLEKVDKSTMANGIESRVPLLDNELTEYVMGLPAEYKVSMGSGKSLLKKALKGTVPDYVLNAPKTGFGVPYSYWLSSSLYDYARNIFEEAASHPDPFFEKKVLLSLLDEHKERPNEQRGFILWKALNLAIWQKQYL